MKLSARVVATSAAGLLVAGLMAAGAAESSAPPAKPLTATEVLARYLKARGGQAALDKTTTFSAKGTFEGLEGAGLSGPVTAELYLKPPDKCLLIISDSSGVFFREGLDGTTGWRGERSGVEDFSPAQAGLVQAILRFHLAYKLMELVTNPVLKDPETIQGNKADVIEAATPQGQTFKLYFDAATGLLTRLTTEFGGASLRYDWGDYQDFDGVKVPVKITAQEGNQNYTVRFKETKRNAPIDDAKFKKPSE